MINKKKRVLFILCFIPRPNKLMIKNKNKIPGIIHQDTKAYESKHNLENKEKE